MKKVEINGNIYYTFLFLLLVIMFVAIARADNPPVFLGSFTKGAPLNLLMDCSNNNTYCAPTAQCNATLQFPNNNTLMLNNVIMGTTFYPKFNVTIPDTSLNGDYYGRQVCCQAGFCGDQPFYFTITPNGEAPNTAKSIFYIGLSLFLIILLVIIMWAHMQDKGEVWKVWWFSIIWLWMIAVTFIAYNMAHDFLTSSGFIESFFNLMWKVLMILFPFYMLFAVLFTFYWIYQNREVQKLINQGFSEEEASDRVSGRRGR